MRLQLLTISTLMACSTAKIDAIDQAELDSAAPVALTDDTGGPVTGDDTATPPDREIYGLMTFNNGRVIDPKLEDASLTFNAAVSGETDGCTVHLGARNGIGQTWTHSGELGAISWDGRDDDGLFFDPGPTTLSIEADCEAEPLTLYTAEAYIVRLGLRAVNLHSDADLSGNVELAFHKKNLFETDVSPIGARPEYFRGPAGVLGSDLDSDDGAPRPIVSTWADPDVPPWVDGDVPRHNVPAAYIASSPVGATVILGGRAVSQARQIHLDAWGPAPEAVPSIRLLLDGAVVSEDAIRPGEPITLSLSDASTTMGKEVRTLTWTFEAEEDETWVPIAGEIQTDHVIYTLAGEPALLDGTDVGKAPPIPWVGVLEDTSTVMEGVAANTSDVLDALRDYLFEHEYIIYDPGSGDYTDFEGEYIYWTSITAQISSFLDRRSGLSLYCHSMSCTLSALAGNHGVYAEQLVLGVYFYTNQTRAAGTSSWQRWSFNSHSVVSPDDGETIWDSSIAMDGDDTPSSEPIDEVMPRGMDGEEYFWRLTYDEIDIVNQGLCYIE